MAKIKTYFECQQCGYQTPRWMGRCPECGSWGTVVEEHPTGGGRGVGVRNPSAVIVLLRQPRRRGAAFRGRAQVAAP